MSFHLFLNIESKFINIIYLQINTMRTEASQLEKIMQNRHTSVSTFVDDRLTTTTNKSESSIKKEPTITKPLVNQFGGYLFKRTSKGFKTWNRRWFYLCENQLLYR